MNEDSNGDMRSLDVPGHSYSYESSQALPSLPSPQNTNGLQQVQGVAPISTHEPINKFPAILKPNAPSHSSSFSLHQIKARPSSPVFSSSSSEGKPAQEEDEELCNVCGDWQNPQSMLLCDECDRGFHMDCLVPPLSAVPEGNWFCPDCMLRKMPKLPKKPRPPPKPKPVALPPPIDPSKPVEIIEYDDGQPCEACRGWKDWNSMLLCDLCDRVYHMKCLNPPLASIPEGNWYCPVCDLSTEADPSDAKRFKRRKKTDDDDEYVLNREELLAEREDDIVFSDDEPIGRKKGLPVSNKGKTKTTTKPSRSRSRDDDSLSESSRESWNSDEMLSDDDDPTRKRRKKKSPSANKSTPKTIKATSKNVSSKKNKSSAPASNQAKLSSIAKLESQPVAVVNGMPKQQPPFHEAVRTSDAGIWMQSTSFRGKQVATQNPNQDPTGSSRSSNSSIAMPLSLSKSLPAHRPSHQGEEGHQRHFQRPVVDDHTSYMMNAARSHHHPQASGQQQVMGNVDEDVMFGINLAAYMGHEWQQPQQQDPRSSQRDNFALHPQMTLMNGFSNHHPQSFVGQSPMQHVMQHGPGSGGGMHNHHHHQGNQQPTANIIEQPHPYGLYGHHQLFQDPGQGDIRNASRQVSEPYPIQTRLPSPLPPPTSIQKDQSPSMHAQMQQQQYNGRQGVDTMDIWSFFNGN